MLLSKSLIGHPNNIRKEHESIALGFDVIGLGLQPVAFALDLIKCRELEEMFEILASPSQMALRLADLFHELLKTVADLDHLFVGQVPLMVLPVEFDDFCLQSIQMREIPLQVFAKGLQALQGLHPLLVDLNAAIRISFSQTL